MLRILIVLSLLLVSSSCAGPRFDRELPVGAMEIEAKQALAAEDFASSRRLFSKGAVTETANYRMLVGLAISEACLGREDAFQAAALSACSEAPWSLTAFLRLGAMYVRGAERFRARPSAGHYAGLGVEYLRRAFIHDASNPDLLHNLGLGLYLMGKTDEGSLILTQAVSRFPKRLDILQLLLTVARAREDRRLVLALLEPREKAGKLSSEWQLVLDWAREK